MNGPLIPEAGRAVVSILQERPRMHADRRGIGDMKAEEAPQIQFPFRGPGKKGLIVAFRNFSTKSASTLALKYGAELSKKSDTMNLL